MWTKVMVGKLATSINANNKILKIKNKKQTIMKTKLDKLRKKGDKLDKKVAKKQAKGKGKAQMKTIVKALKNEDEQRKERAKVNEKKPLTKKKTTTAKGTKVKEKLKKGTIKVKTKSPSGSKRKFAVSTNAKSLNPTGPTGVNDPQKYKNRRKAKKGSPVKMTGKAYDNKEAYNKNLSASARLHYLENERSDDTSPMSMYGKKESPMNMYGKKSPLEKELVGKQENLPAGLKAKIEASPAKMYGKKESPMNMSDELKYDGPVIDQMKSLSQMGASKVLKHMKK